MMTDPIADMLTRIRNAVHVRQKTVDVPASRARRGLAEILVKEGYIAEARIVEATPQPWIRIHLKYAPDGEPAIKGLVRRSKPGCRVYAGVAELPRVRRGLGTAIVSTSRGIMADREARQQKLGGEVLCEVW